MLKKIILFSSLIWSNFCFAKGFIVSLADRNVWLFDQHEKNLMIRKDKKMLSKLQLKYFIVNSIAQDLVARQFSWTHRNEPSIHGLMHRILYSFKDEYFVYLLEEKKHTTRVAKQRTII